MSGPVLTCRFGRRSNPSTAYGGPPPFSKGGNLP